MSSTGFDFDTVKLAEYLEQHVEGFKGPLTAEKFAGEHGIEHALAKHRHEITGDDTREDQVNIVADAARWARFWSQRGHGAEPFF